MSGVLLHDGSQVRKEGVGQIRHDQREGGRGAHAEALGHAVDLVAQGVNGSVHKTVAQWLESPSDKGAAEGNHWLIYLPDALAAIGREVRRAPLARAASLRLTIAMTTLALGSILAIVTYHGGVWPARRFGG